MVNRKRRNILAWLLLVAYLPMLFASVMHTHRPVDDSDRCYQCVHHLSHPAHYSVPSDSVHHCLYCHLLWSPKLVTVAMVAATAVIVSRYLCRIETIFVPVCKNGIVSLRAPPFADILS